MNIIALGTSGTYPRFGRACSGYLIADDPVFVQIDLGTGALANLFRYIDPTNLSSIILTHMHADHVLDIYPLRYYLQYNHRENDGKIKVYLPEGGLEVLHRFNPGGDNGNFLESVFDFESIESFEKYGDDFSICIGSLYFRFRKTDHVIPAYAVVIENRAGRKVGYTSDTSYEESLIDFFKGCEILICEAAYQGEQGKKSLHMTAYEAGIFAREAGVKKLYLTHLWPELNPEVSKQDAEKTFGDEVIILKEHMVIEV